MDLRFLYKLLKRARNVLNVLHGYNHFVDTDKLRLIDRVYKIDFPTAKSFVDFGGVWNVNGAYSLYTLRNYAASRGILVDTDFPPGLQEKLLQSPNLSIINGDFARQTVASRMGAVDVAYFFDVLLHQANPSWDEVLEMYSASTLCIVIHNQQYVRGQKSVRLTQLPIDEYLAITPKSRHDICRYIYDHALEIHPTYRKPWIDIHNITQWGITDKDLRTKMTGFGFHEVYFRNCGRFPSLEGFENHQFIFLRHPMVDRIRT